jgi:hypothetical protein
MKKFRIAIPVIYSFCLIVFTIYCLMDTFVISHVYRTVEAEAESLQSSQGTQSQDENIQSSQDTRSQNENIQSSQDTRSQNENIQSYQDTSTHSEVSEQEDDSLNKASQTAAITTGSLTPSSTIGTYSENGVTITVYEYRYESTSVYAADVVLSSASSLRTAFAQNAYGKNVTAKTSETAETVNAVLAVNGDYYGARESGYVIRNGVIYRNTMSSADQEDLVIYSDGSMKIIREGEITAEELLADGAVNVLSFGPSVVENSTISVTKDEEVGKAMASNPRTAIGIIDPLHYLLVVSDGRTNESEGLTLYQLAEFMQKAGCTTAYNLDGGGSSTMYFNEEVINNPTTNGRSIKERAVSDIIYIS